jgi:hypothetical protein
MYVTKAAVTLLSSLLVHQDISAQAVSEQYNNSKEHNMLGVHSHTKLHHMIDDLWINSPHEAETRLVILQILNEAFSKCSNESLNTLYRSCDVFDKVFTVLKSCDDFAARNQAIVILTQSKRYTFIYTLM